MALATKGIDFMLRKIPKDLHRRLKIKAAEQGISMRDLILKYISRGLET